MSEKQTPRKEIPKGFLRICVCHKGQRVNLDVNGDQSVYDVKEIVREIFGIGPDEGPSSADVQDRKVLSLVYAGSDLDNDWTLTDIGIVPGSTLKAKLKEVSKPSMFIHCNFNREMVPLFDKINARIMTVGEFRGISSRKVGLPVSAFRLLNSIEDGKEMFDCCTLDDYGIGLGMTVRLETWDGFNDILNLALMGFTSHVMANLSSADDVLARYQSKVALYIAAHFGHVDLAVSLLRQGLRADEAIGEHPSRQWCKESVRHIDILKAPIHEAVEAGQLGVLRSFVHQNVCNVLAKDGNNLTPLNIALRRKQKLCAKFLLTKQWSKISYNKKSSIPLSIFVKMKRWSDKSKEKVLMIHGQWKSSIKNPKKHINTGALVGNGVQLDGFSKSKMNSKPRHEVIQEEEEEERNKRPLFDFSDDAKLYSPDSEQHFKTGLKLPKVNKTGRLVANKGNAESDETKEDVFDSRSRSDQKDGRLPPIQESKNRRMRRNLSISHQNLTHGTKIEPEFQDGKPISKAKSMYFRTGSQKQSVSSQSVPEEKENENEPPDSMKRQKDRSLKREIMKAKARSDGSLALPVSRSDSYPRPFIRSQSEFLTQGTLSVYERYRKQTPRDYAIKCLTIANSFKEKPWLQQVNQALIIAKQGVKKIVNKQPTLFHVTADDDFSEQDNESTGRASMVQSAPYSIATT